MKEFPAAGAETERPFLVLRIHEPALGQQPHLVNGLTSHHHASAGEPLDLAEIAVVMSGVKVDSFEKMPPGKETRQEKPMVDGAPQCRSVSGPEDVQARSTMVEARPHGACFRIADQKISHPLQGVVPDFSIRVQQDDEGRCGAPNGLIVCCGKAPVLLIDDQCNRWEGRANHSTLPSCEPLSTTRTFILVGSDPLKREFRHAESRSCVFQLTMMIVRSGAIELFRCFWRYPPRASAQGIAQFHKRGLRICRDASRCYRRKTPGGPSDDRYKALMNSHRENR